MKMKKYMIDFPSGWQYGFPMEVSETITTQEIRDLLRRQKYPENDIEFALTYMRCWYIHKLEIFI